LFIDIVREFHARVRKKLHAVVLKRIVRSGNHDAGLKVVLAHQASDARGSNDSREGHRCAGLREPCGEKRSDVRAGLARVHADQNMRCAMLALQVAAEGAPRGIECGVIERRRAGGTANAVGSEELFGHARETGSSRAAAAKRVAAAAFIREDNFESLTQGKRPFESAAARVSFMKERAVWICRRYEERGNERIKYPTPIGFAGMC